MHRQDWVRPTRPQVLQYRPAQLKCGLTNVNLTRKVPNPIDRPTAAVYATQQQQPPDNVHLLRVSRLACCQPYRLVPQPPLNRRPCGRA
jgi:hypothetical protein